MKNTVVCFPLIQENVFKTLMNLPAPRWERLAMRWIPK